MKTLTIALILASTLVFNLNAAKPTASRPQAVAGAIASSLKNKYITADPATDKIEMTVTNGAVVSDYPYTITLTPDGINFNITKVDYTAPRESDEPFESMNVTYKYAVGSDFKKALKIINNAKIKNEEDPYALMLDGGGTLSILLYKKGKPYAEIHHASVGEVWTLAKQIQDLIPDFDNELLDIQYMLDSNDVDPNDLSDTNPNSYHYY